MKRHRMVSLGRCGQSILEYSVIFVVVVGVILVVVPAVFKPKVTNLYVQTGEILDKGSNLTKLVGGSPANTTP